SQAVHEAVARRAHETGRGARAVEVHQLVKIAAAVHEDVHHGIAPAAVHHLVVGGGHAHHGGVRTP
ncbi:MAG: hypothetical protein ACK559_01635, partial [bacterium]